MPRTVIYDLKGGFGSMRRVNALYMDAEEQEGKTPRALWYFALQYSFSFPPILSSLFFLLISMFNQERYKADDTKERPNHNPHFPSHRPFSLHHLP